MDRDKSNDPAEILATRPNGRIGAPLVINRNGSRKDLFGGRQPQSKPSNGSHARSGSASLSPDHKPNSPNSRIPRPHSNSPRTLSIKEAYTMVVEAEEREAAQGSPSPAPRTWRSRLDGGEKIEKSPSQAQGSRRRTGTGNPATAPSSRRGTVISVGSSEADKLGGDDSDSDIDHKITQFGKEQQHRGADEAQGPGGGNGLFAKSRLGSKVAKTGQELSRTTSNGSLDSAAPPTGYQPWGLKAGSTSGWLKRAMSSPEDRNNRPGANGLSDEALISAPTPNKSFAWDDADFTAGDLLVSNSPPVKTGRTSNPPYRNTRLDEIRALEIEAELNYPDEPPEPSTTEDSPGHRRSTASAETHSPQSRPLGRTNTKLDEIRAREIESLSRRAVATARLDEIRERNAEARSRSSSPEIPRKSSREVFRESPLLDEGPIKPGNGPSLDGGEQIRGAPVTFIKETPPGAEKKDDRPGQKTEGSRAGPEEPRRDPVPRVDSHDLLRRLARATSTSPAPEQQTAKREAKDRQDPTSQPAKESTFRDLRKERNVEKATDKPKAVGFAGLQREPSSDSLSDKQSKRSSLALSDNDPTERIEREMQLFAPMDNYSEKGSIRAPSPAFAMEDDVEETPRPVRIDPLTQPTPKVTGAYVETPATVKIERLGDVPAIIEPGVEGASSDPLATARGRKVEIPLRKPTHTSSASGGRGAERSKSQPRSFRRAQSLPRARSPLINSVRPPTVKDDLLEIQRTYQIEDSTLDDLEGFFAAQDKSPDTTSADQDAKPDPVKIEITETQDSLTDQKNSKAINRIGRSLESIRTARKGIERLEDEVSKAKEVGHKAPVTSPEMAHTHHHIHSDHAASTCPICLSQPPSNIVAYVHVPVPRLWRRSPTFRVTFLGFVVSILSLWYVAETTMCALYCKPEFCYAGKPCRWTYDDPFWGYAIPVKLDQWTTGGQGRALFQKVQPEVSDWLADVWDVVTGTDIREVDTRGYDWEQRRQHRRRMRKKGFVKAFVEPNRPEDREKYEAWRRARIAKEEADARREMGYPNEEETMAADERVR